MPAQDVLIIGLGYVGLPLAVQAALAGFRVTGYDGHDVPRAEDLQAAAAAADLVILLQAHRDYDLAWIAATARLLLDTRGVVPAAAGVEAL